MQTTDKIGILNKIVETVEGDFKPNTNINWQQLQVNKSGVLDEYIIKFTVFEERNFHE